MLRYLAERAGRPVSKDELIQIVWSGVFVSDDFVVQCIHDIREALGDEFHRIIKTVSRRGYLFAADISGKALNRTSSSPTARHQQVTFCRTSDGVNIAVGSVGHGLPLVKAATHLCHLEYEWENPIRAPLLNFLADRYRLIRYDCRGVGLSDRDVVEFAFEGLNAILK